MYSDDSSITDGSSISELNDTSSEDMRISSFDSSTSSSNQLGSDYTNDEQSWLMNVRIKCLSHTYFVKILLVIFCIFLFLVSLGVGIGIVWIGSGMSSRYNLDDPPKINIYGYQKNSSGEFGYFETEHNINYFANYKTEFGMEVFPFGDDEDITGSEYQCELVDDWEDRVRYFEEFDDEEFQRRMAAAGVVLSARAVKAMIAVLMTVGTLTFFADSIEDAMKMAAEYIYDKLPDFIQSHEVLDWIRINIAPYLVATTIMVCWWKDDLWKKRRVEATAICVYCDTDFSTPTCGQSETKKKFSGWRKVGLEKCDIPWETRQIRMGHRLVEKTGGRLGKIDPRGFHPDLLRKLDFQCYRGRAKHTTKADQTSLSVSLVRGEVKYDHCEFQEWERKKYSCLSEASPRY